MSNQGGLVLPCTCQNEFQDKEYGKGKRLHNYCKHPTSKDEMKGARCTVCSKVKSL